MKKAINTLLFCLIQLSVLSQSNKLEDYIVDRFIDSTGRETVGVIVPGIPPGDFNMPVAEPTESSVILSDVPGYDWCFGCSATSGAMIAGYYDRTGYDNMYAGSTNGGVAPMNNSTWGGDTINGEYRKMCPISATRNGLDGRTTNGHVDDYWIKYGSTTTDPWITNGWTEHTWEDCTGDYMGTNQSSFSNSDGSTTFYYFSNGQPLYNYNADSGKKDGCYGLRKFFESRDYTVTSNYSQWIHGYNGNTQGFTFNQFKNEIDNGRPVMIQVTGHSMVGYGYDDATQTVYIRDTWDYNSHTMTWGGTYSGMTHYMVTVFVLADAPYIDITSPDGGESWAQGSSQTITWSDNISENVKIELYKNGSLNSTLASSTPSDGSFSWTVSPSQTVGSDYQVVITSVTYSYVNDTSDTDFSIVSSVPTNRTVQNVTLNDGDDQCYDATQTITVAGSGTTFNLQSGASATFVAGQSICFKPGTHVYSGGYLNAYITTGGLYCSVVSSPSNNHSGDHYQEIGMFLPEENPVEKGFIIYPNPTNDKIYFRFFNESMKPESAIEIFDMKGLLITRIQLLEANKLEFDLSSYPKGLYFVRWSNSDHMGVSKVIKN